MDIRRVYAALRLPRYITIDNGARIPGIEAFCILLFKLSRPYSLKSIGEKFARSRMIVSRIVNKMMRKIYRRCKKILYWDEERLHTEQLWHYAHAIARRNEHRHRVNNVFAFIDGTIQKIARPFKFQRQLYNGWKRCHCIKFQGLMAPDGIMIHLGGPFMAKYHDAWMLARSKLQCKLDQMISQDSGLRVYGDAGYVGNFPWVTSAL